MSTFLRWKRRTQHDFSREIDAHLELDADRFVAEGMTPEQARVAARRAFGNVASANERFYESHRLMWLDRTRQDLRSAARSLVRYPVAALVAVLSLAAGIGATTTTLTVRNTIFRNPPPLYRDPAELSRIQVARQDRPIQAIGAYVPGALFTMWRDMLGAAVAAATPTRGARDVRTDDRTQSVVVRAVTPNFFTLIGIVPALGHLFSDAADVASDSPPAVLSYGVWQRVFDGHPDVVGRTIWIDDRAHTIIGVAPRPFWFSDMNAPIWTVLDRTSAASADALEVFARRPRGVTPDTLAASLQPGLVAYSRGLPAFERPLRTKLSAFRGTPMGAQMSIVLPYVLGTAVLLTLLIACANVAILMIAQWTAREHEIAIRASLGASRWRIVRGLLTESVLVAAAGGALGVCATFALRGVLLHRTSIDASLFDLRIDPSVLVQSAVITFIAGLVVGAAPALVETRRLQTNPLTSIATPERVRQRWRHALVILEITVTVALLVVTAAMVDGYLRTRSAQLGFRNTPLMAARVENPSGVPIARLLEALDTVPGVASAASATSIPYTTVGPTLRVAADAAGHTVVTAERAEVTSRFFSTLDVPMRAGRALTNADTPAAHVAVINETLANALLRGANPIGARLWIATTPYEVVGVVADYSNHPYQTVDYNPKLFVPYGVDAKAAKRATFLIRAVDDPAAVVSVIRRRLRDAAAGDVVTSIFTFDQIVTAMGQEHLVGTAPLVPLIAIGLLLTTAGIYGVLAFGITRRSRELAVRVAIGASNGHVVRLVTAHSFRLLAIGALLGLGATAALAQIVRAAGAAGTPFDPAWPIYAVAVGVVLAVGAVATWIPSRRALKIDPAMLLRST